jgi:hypothetical protein
MTKQIRVKLSYNVLFDKDVATQGVAVVDGMTNNPKFLNPPIHPADLKTQVAAYASLIAAAADGSKKVITERKKQRAAVVKMLRQLGHWVEANCNDDAATLQSSGYQQQATPVRNASPQPLDGPPSFRAPTGYRDRGRGRVSCFRPRVSARLPFDNGPQDRVVERQTCRSSARRSSGCS